MGRTAAMVGTVAALAVGCEPSRTALVLRVDSEIPWGAGTTLQSLVVSVRRSGNDGPLRDRRTITLGTASGQQTLPFWVGVLAGDDVSTPVWVEVLGCAGASGCTTEQAVVAQRAVARFATGQTLELPLRLTAECVRATCAADERCTAGPRCEPATRAQLDLRPFEGIELPTAADAAPPSDQPVSRDAPVVMDLPAVMDVPVARDVPVVMDAPVPRDMPVVMDAPPDAGVARDVGADAARDAARDVGGPPADDGAVCASGQVLCAGTCRSLLSDTNHCGECARACASGQTCVTGVCTTPPPCPVRMRLIPAGMFDMGSTTVMDEQPIHGVRLSAFCLDETEVTVAAFRACVTAGACVTPGMSPMCNWMVAGRDDHPINCVAWQEALTYCQWRGATLPTEARWEYAARFTSGRTYPWGNDTPGSQLCWSGGGENRSSTCAVGTFPLGNTPFGISDLAGGVWEWVADWSGPYTGSTGSYVLDPTGPTSGSVRVIRGGSWNNTAPGDVRGANRFVLAPLLRDVHVGLRCAREPN